MERFPLIPPFNVLDLTGPVDHTDASREHYRRTLYYRDNTVGDLFILNSPNSHYTAVVEISGAEVKVIQCVIYTIWLIMYMTSSVA